MNFLDNIILKGLQLSGVREVMNLKDLKECTKPHQVTHTVFGVGLGVLLVGLFPTLGAQAVVVGVVVAVAALAYDYFMVK